jgi:hypothetical protein
MKSLSPPVQKKKKKEEREIKVLSFCFPSFICSLLEEEGKEKTLKKKKKKQKQKSKHKLEIFLFFFGLVFNVHFSPQNEGGKSTSFG